MPGRDHFINKIRELGYRYKTQAKRVSIWKKGGDPHRVMLPTWEELPDDWCRSTLLQCGCTEEEIEDFLRSSNG